MTHAFRLVVLVFLIGLCGCGSGRPTPVPVKGKVLYQKSTPAVGALVVFHPVDPAVEKQIGGKPYGKVKEDGSFSLTMYHPDDGAPPGEYGVTIDWQVPKNAKMNFSIGEGGNTMSKLNPRYSSPQSPAFKKVVQSGTTNEFLFEVD